MLLGFLLSTSVATVQPATRLMASSAAGSGSAGQPAEKATLKPAAAKASDPSFEVQTEQQLLAFANQSRQQAGALPLTMDAGLSQAARVHAQAMARAQRLSHQLDGEPSLPQRLAATTQLQLEEEGENVALAYDALQGHELLMHSPPHRANLLNPVYNVVGLGVARNGEQLYIVQDFGSAPPKYSAVEVKAHVAAAVTQIRRQAGQPQLHRHDWLGADDDACSMAQADKLVMPSSTQLAESRSLLTYTTLHPDSLPGGADRAVAAGNLRSFSIGACFGRTPTYPTGTYWVVVSLA
jgi:uncharacterized protein YkwD